MAGLGPLHRAVRRGATSPVSTDLPEVKDLQRQVAEQQRAFNPATQGNVFDFVLLDPAAPTGPAVLNLPHKLGRVPQGWQLLDLVCPQVSTIVSRLMWDDRVIRLFSDRQCYGRILVF